MDELDIETFGGIMDEMIEKSDVKLLVNMPENSNEIKLDDNMGGGPVLQFYILINALAAAISELMEMLDKDKVGEMLDAMFEIAKDGILKDLKEEKDG